VKRKAMERKPALDVPLVQEEEVQTHYRIRVAIERVERGPRVENIHLMADRILSVSGSSIKEFDRYWRVALQPTKEEQTE